MKIAFLLLLAACGDNIRVPDAALDFDYTDITPGKPDGAVPGDDLDAGAAPDAAPVATCDDKHIDLNGHEHKCQHDSK